MEQTEIDYSPCAILKRAKTLLEEEGWIKHVSYREGEGYCLTGALYAASGWKFGEHNALGMHSNTITSRFLLAEARIPRIGYFGLEAFNDNYKTRKEDVLGALDVAIEGCKETAVP